MFSFPFSSQRFGSQTPYERLVMSPEPVYLRQSHSTLHRLLQLRFTSKRTLRNILLMSSFLLSLLLVILLYIFGPLLYRITQLPSYDRYREVENSRRPSVTAVDGGSAGRGPVGAVKYFFPEKRLIGALLHLSTMDTRVISNAHDYPRPGYSGAGWGNIIQEEILNALLAYSSNRSYVLP